MAHKQISNTNPRNSLHLVPPRHSSSPPSGSLTGWGDEEESFILFPVSDQKESFQKPPEQPNKPVPKTFHSSKSVSSSVPAPKQQLKLDQLLPILKTPAIIVSDGQERVKKKTEDPPKIISKRPQSQIGIGVCHNDEGFQTQGKIGARDADHVCNICRYNKRSSSKTLLHENIVIPIWKPIRSNIIQLEAHESKNCTPSFSSGNKQRKVKKLSKSPETVPRTRDKEEQSTRYEEDSPHNSAQMSRQVLKGSLKLLNRNLNFSRKTFMGISRLVSNSDIWQVKNHCPDILLTHNPSIPTMETFYNQKDSNIKTEYSSKLKFSSGRGLFNQGAKDYDLKRSSQTSLFSLRRSSCTRESSNGMEITGSMIRMPVDLEELEKAEPSAQNGKLKLVAKQMQEKPKGLQRISRARSNIKFRNREPNKSSVDHEPR